jgi:hypothetical protein
MKRALTLRTAGPFVLRAFQGELTVIGLLIFQSQVINLATLWLYLWIELFHQD